MKRYFIPIVFCVLLISCSKETPTTSNSNQFEDGEVELVNYELVFEEVPDLIPLSKNPECIKGFESMECKKKEQELKDRVINIIKNIDESIKVEESNVRVYMDVSIYLENLTLDQVELLENESTENNFTLFKSIDIQARRPVMQSEYILQARRPVMQEQLRYDTLKKASKLILSVGGGLPSSTVLQERVWIIDTGIDLNHQDLVFDNAEKNLSKSFPNSNTGPFEDDLGHGTMIAGIIGGLASSDPIYANGYGINGVFPGAKMISIKVFKEKKSNTGILGNALNYIYKNCKAGDIVNISLGYEINSPNSCENGNVFNNIRKLVEDKGVYLVMSAGNNAEESLKNFPGCIELNNHPDSVKSRVFTIGSTETVFGGEFLYSSFSNFGEPSIDYLEPGEDILTTAPGGMYVTASGTSLSAAIFSGILYHKESIGILDSLQRGADSGESNPYYSIGKIGN
jgi:hypothetical protein